ncbi:plasmid pRiA4b ORF-3 family protein [Nocardia huaxiensis]|uniref:Plasmid pRiA4b ORF-3 family protein n=1 Tax=Nocardia huaxiensis TaxID=2755382 RepID=A0A7D6VFV0_9NOCA|nr:plasmid pRiA4b ORF-3 family protein [Nocardia huaxiensis]QLY33482.1 plasmid pRiA4b ORF-3 family protein [Nocardia huaxiensis]
MTPVSRGRKAGKRGKPSRSEYAELADLRRKFGSAVTGFDPFEDPLDAELLAAYLLETLADDPGDVESQFVRAVLDIAIPGIAAAASSKAVAILRAIAALTVGEVSMTAAGEADRLIAQGVAVPPWVAELSEPVTVSDCTRVSEPEDDVVLLLAAIHRAGRSHVLVAAVDHLDDGGVVNLSLSAHTRVSEFLDDLRETMPDQVSEPLSPASFRTQLESALEIRSDRYWHARQILRSSVDAQEDIDNEDDYRALAKLVRARLAGLPAAPVPHDVDGSLMDLPPRRGESDGRAPIAHLKVRLPEVYPTIWRRLEVPFDITLEHLHRVLQAAFGWETVHPYLFLTRSGAFTNIECDCGGHRSESLTLEQIAEGQNARLAYRYDPDEQRELHILLTRLSAPEQDVRYPRCTGGRRSVAPEPGPAGFDMNRINQTLEA